VSADVRVESGRSGKLGAEVRLRGLSAIVDPRSGEREGEEERASGRDGPFPPTLEREARFLVSQRAAAAAAAGTIIRRGRRQPTAVSARGERGPGGGGGGGGGSSRVAVKHVSH
jgi:hypothetical protein